jgi:hypothetical protein
MRLPALLAVVIISASLAASAPVGATVRVVAPLAVQLDPPAVTIYGTAGTIGGRLVPAVADVGVDLMLGDAVIAHTQTGADGLFSFTLRLKNPGPYSARAGAVVSESVMAPIRPRLKTSVRGTRIVGQQLMVRARVRPAAGRLRLVVVHGGRRVLGKTVKAGKKLELPTGRTGAFIAWIETVARSGYRETGREFHYRIRAPGLGWGARGASVRVLERSLVAHRFALLRPDSSYDADTVEAVYALQKMAGLSRTGYVDAATWLALDRVKPPRPRLGGNYIASAR